MVSLREKIMEIILSDEKYKGVLSNHPIEIKLNDQSKGGVEFLYHDLTKI